MSEGWRSGDPASRPELMSRAPDPLTLACEAAAPTSGPINAHWLFGTGPHDHRIPPQSLPPGLSSTGVQASRSRVPDATFCVSGISGSMSSPAALETLKGVMAFLEGEPLSDETVSKLRYGLLDNSLHQAYRVVDMAEVSCHAAGLLSPGSLIWRLEVGSTSVMKTRSLHGWAQAALRHTMRVMLPGRWANTLQRKP